jgi:translocation and assembly module TamB
VTVPEARIEPRQFVGAVLPSSDERIVRGDEEAQEATEGYRVSTDVRLILGKAVRIDAFGLKGRLEGEVVARTRPDEVPIASGELEIEDAKYKAYSRELDVERGRLLFPGGPVADPGIDLRATKEVPGYEIGVIVRGRLRRPELTLWSNPSLPQSQIASLVPRQPAGRRPEVARQFLGPRHAGRRAAGGRDEPLRRPGRGRLRGGR